MGNISVNVTGLVEGLRHVADSRSFIIIIAALGWVLAAILLFILMRKRDSSNRISQKAQALRGNYFQEVKTGIIRNQR